MNITRGEEIKFEDHPCECSNIYVEFEEEETIHIKRNYWEHIQWFWCKNCECHWNKVTWLVGQYDWIELVQPPQEEEE